MTGPGFVMMVGPGEARLAVHTLSLVRSLYPKSPVWVRDDATADGTAETLTATFDSDPLTVVSSNTSRRGYFGICRSIFDIFSEAINSPIGAECPFFIKLDPDAMVCSSTLTDVVRQHFETKGPGILGAVNVGPSGIRRDHSRAARNLRIDSLLPLAPAKTGSRIRTSRPFWLSMYRSAKRHGYIAGTGVQAGAFAIAAETLVQLAECGFLSAMPENYTAMTYEEDTLLAIGVKGIGHELHELSDTALLWWVQYRSPIAEQIQYRAAQGPLALVHPLKDNEHDWSLRRRLSADAR